MEQQYITYDLGEPYDISAVYIWNYAFQGKNDRGVKQFDIVGAGSDGLFDVEIAQNLTLDAVKAYDAGKVQKKPVRAGGIQYVRIEIDSNHGADKLVGLSEIRFEGTPSEQKPLGLIMASADMRLNEFIISGADVSAMVCRR